MCCLFLFCSCCAVLFCFALPVLCWFALRFVVVSCCFVCVVFRVLCVGVVCLCGDCVVRRCVAGLFLFRFVLLCCV